jgi:hypothetical protein
LPRLQIYAPYPVAADRNGVAVGTACVVISPITVITDLKTCLPSIEIGSPDAVTTKRYIAGVATRIIIELVAIVAALDSGTNEAVPTTCGSRTIAKAGIGRFVVAVIASFVAFVVRFKVITLHTVATASHC